MGKKSKSRRGSMAFWPRKRSKKMYPRIRSWPESNEPGVLGFAGYKAGMTHITGTDNRKYSHTKGEDISFPVTVIECPPLKIFCARFYQKNAYGLHPIKDFFFKPDKHLKRKISLPKKTPDIREFDKINPEEYEDITVLAYTNPRQSGLGKKKPEIFELKLGGSNKEKKDFIKQHAEKEISVDEVLKEAQYVDAHAISRGRGTQGPVRRFGIGLKPHKSEKGRRQPGSRGPWISQQHIMYRTAYAGQTGCFQRMQLNLQILKTGNKPEEINPDDGFPHYGKIKTKYLLLKGSVPGSKKRMIILTPAQRPPKQEAALMSITNISRESKQGR